MKVGLGLPISDPESLLTWARRAEAGTFTTVALLDRLVYSNPEPLVALAAIAGATSRVRVQTEVLLAPLRDPVLLAKQAATLDRISNGRFTLGIGVGTREDDYAAAEVDFSRRGRRLDGQLPILRRIWAGPPNEPNEPNEPSEAGAPGEIGPTPSRLGGSEEPTASAARSAGPPSGGLSAGAASLIGPAPTRPGGPEVLFGGFRPAALERVARWGDGFLCAAPAEWAGRLFRTVEQAWRDADRSGRPRLVAQVNVALGPPSVVEEARREIRAYYGPGDWTDGILERVLIHPGQVRDALAAFTDLGADEVVLYCWSPQPDQVDRLADAAA